MLYNQIEILGDIRKKSKTVICNVNLILPSPFFRVFYYIYDENILLNTTSNIEDKLNNNYTNIIRFIISEEKKKKRQSYKIELEI
jgi:hypothetical protein